MKTMNTLLLAGAVALAFTLTTTARADEPFLSPKAKEQADSLRKVPGTTPDLISRSVMSGSPKAIALAESLRTVPSGTVTPNLVSGNFNSAASKANGGTLPQSRFEIAPLVGKDKLGKICEAGCTMPCCAKK